MNPFAIQSVSSHVTPPPWLDRDMDDIPRPRTSPMESGGPRAFASISPDNSPAGIKYRIARKSITSDQLLHLRHRKRQSTPCLETMRRQADPLRSDITTTPDAEKTGDDAIVNRVVDDDDSPGGESASEIDTDNRRRRAREWQRSQRVHVHPGPLNSNPTRSHHDSTPRAITSFTAEMHAKLHDIRGSLINRIGRPTSKWWEEDGSGGRSRTSLTPPALRSGYQEHPTLCSVPVTPVLRASAILDESDLSVHQELADLKSEIITLKSLKKLHEEAMGSFREEKVILLNQKKALEATILRNESRILESDSSIRAQQATIDYQESAISKLSRQLNSKDAEQGALVANFATELASRDNDLIALKDEKWTLQRKVTELEQMVAKAEAQLQQWGRMGRRIPRKLKISSLGDTEGDVDATSSAEPESSTPDDRVGRSAMNSSTDSDSVNVSGLMISDASAAGSPKSRIAEIGSPNSSFGSPFTPGTSPNDSCSSWVTPTLPRNIRPFFHFQSQATPSTSAGESMMSTSSSTRPSSRRRRSLSSQTTAVAMAEEDTMTAALRPSMPQQQLHQRDPSTSSQQKGLAAEVFGLERTSALKHNKQSSLNELSLWGHAKGATQMRPIERSGHNSSSLPILPSLSTPELPALTYGRSLTVWLDRIVTIFKYLNLSSFLRPLDNAATNTSERLRAAIILKGAVNDDILEDVLFLLSRKETQSNSSSTEPGSSASECPHLLLSGILTIHGLVSGSPSEGGWVDRISEAELGGVEDFASLVLCIDKRRSSMFAATVDHYDGMLPRIQESVHQRGPELESPLPLDAVANSWPKKKSQLSTWMGGLVKRRQTRLERGVEV